MKKLILGLAMLVALTAIVSAEPTPKGFLFLEGSTVGTVVPPDNIPDGTGTNPLYVFGEDSAEGQLGVATYGPGDKEYRGGRWAISTVEWNVEPYLMTSAQEVLDAETAGDVTITRQEELDNRCPITKKNNKFNG